MSMRNYAFVAYGVVLNKLVDTDVLEELAEADLISQQSLTGETFKMKDNGCEDWGDSDYYDDETVYYISVPKYPDFFKAAYRDMKSLMQAMRRAVRKVEGLPKLTAKQIRDNFMSIQGTYYG